ncbi:MAG: hypothetical protein V1903_10340 [Bacteroidota bacterium]
MKKIFFLTGILILSTAFALNAQQTGTKSNTARQGSQQARIQQGRRTGELTRFETARLQREQRKIQIEKKMANSDGTVTPAEKRFIRREQNRAGRHIARQKNDAQDR